MSWLVIWLALNIICLALLGVVYYVTPRKEYHRALEIAMLVAALVMAVSLIVLLFHVWEPADYHPQPGQSF